MFELPLFPLNTVLFPDMPLPLHIFEERYKIMMDTCIQEKRPFGVVLIREGAAEFDPLVTPHPIGCTAKIIQVQHLNEGDLFIMAVGEKRFRIHSLQRDKPYLVGQVEYAPLETEQVKSLDKAVHRLYPLVVDYLNILAQVGKVEFDTSQIPTDPSTFVYLAASIIQVPVEKKQNFLAEDDATQLLNDLRHVYHEEVPLLRLIPAQDQGIFSMN